MCLCTVRLLSDVQFGENAGLRQPSKAPRPLFNQPRMLFFFIFFFFSAEHSLNTIVVHVMMSHVLKSSSHLVFSALCGTKQVLVSSLRHSAAKLVCMYHHNGCIVWPEAPGPQAPSIYKSGLFSVCFPPPLSSNPPPLYCGSSEKSVHSKKCVLHG